MFKYENVAYRQMLVTGACGDDHGCTLTPAKNRLAFSGFLQIPHLQEVFLLLVLALAFLFRRLLFFGSARGPLPKENAIQKDNKHPRLEQSHKASMWVLSYYHRPSPLKSLGKREPSRIQG